MVEKKTGIYTYKGTMDAGTIDIKFDTNKGLATIKLSKCSNISINSGEILLLIQVGFFADSATLCVDTKTKLN